MRLISVLLSAAVISTAFAAEAADERPLFRIGFFTDTHVRPKPASVDLVKKSFEVFKAQECAAVIHCGDLADWHFDEAYRLYLEALETTFPPGMPNRPQFLYVCAGHDTLDPTRSNPKLRTSRAMKDDVAYGRMIKKLKIDHDWRFARRDVCGYPILVFPQGFDFADMEREVSKACADHPDKPVFLCSHVPTKNTCYGSESAGGAVGKILSRYPQVVFFTGHSHASLLNEKSIWQGGFTAVNVGSLHSWDGGRPDFAFWVLVAEVYPKRIVFRRIDVRDGCEQHADSRWVMPLPFDPATAPLAFARRRQAERLGRFPAGAAIACSTDAEPFDVLTASFPPVEDEAGVECYRLGVWRKDANGKWTCFVKRDVRSGYGMRPQDRNGGTLSCRVSSAFFDDAGTDYRLTVTPVGFFGTKGMPLETVWKAPAGKRGRVIWSCDDPMGELEFVSGNPTDGSPDRVLKKVPVKDGWYMPTGNVWLNLKKGLWDLPKGTKFRLVVDMGLDQPDEVEGWLMFLRVNDGTLRSIGKGRQLSPSGRMDSYRYVVEADLKVPGLDYAVTFLYSHPGRIRFDRIRLEVFDPSAARRKEFL